MVGCSPPPPSDWTIVKVVHEVALLKVYWGGGNIYPPTVPL